MLMDQQCILNMYLWTETHKKKAMCWQANENTTRGSQETNPVFLPGTMVQYLLIQCSWRLLQNVSPMSENWMCFMGRKLEKECRDRSGESRKKFLIFSLKHSCLLNIYCHYCYSQFSYFSRAWSPFETERAKFEVAFHIDILAKSK